MAKYNTVQKCYLDIYARLLPTGHGEILNVSHVTVQPTEHDLN